MSRHLHPPATKAVNAKSLAQQERDYTAEGSPPPGKVAELPPESEAANKAAEAAEAAEAPPAKARRLAGDTPASKHR